MIKTKHQVNQKILLIVNKFDFANSLVYNSIMNIKIELFDYS